MTIIEPLTGRHRCKTPGSLAPKDQWPTKRVFGRQMRIPMLWELGTIWVCPSCCRPWYADSLPANPPGGPYQGGGRRWRRVRWYHRAMRDRLKRQQTGLIYDEDDQ